MSEGSERLYRDACPRCVHLAQEVSRLEGALKGERAKAGNPKGRKEFYVARLDSAVVGVVRFFSAVSWVVGGGSVMLYLFTRGDVRKGALTLSVLALAHAIFALYYVRRRLALPPR